MKIVCEACQAKYSISDEKVRGKAFKIRCKKCSHIIVVRAADAGSGASPLPMADSGLVTAAANTEHAWHIVVDGEQVGPLSASDIKARRARGEITAETYIWREGMADWLKLSAVPELADGAGDESATPFPAQSSPANEGVFSSNGGSDVFAAPTTVGSPMAPDLFASPVSAGSQSGSSSASSSSFGFGGGGGNHAEGSGLRNGSGMGNSLTGQRHENSVLFSLSNLEALAAPQPSSRTSPRPGVSSPASEGSGLIDIRSMAAMTLGNANHDSRASDLPSFGSPQFSPVAPVLLPIGPASGPPRWLYPVLGVLVLVIAGLSFLTIRFVTARPAPLPAPAVAVAPPPPAAVTPPPARTTTPPVTPPPSSTEPLPPREEKAGSAAGATKAPPHPSRATRRARAAAIAEATAPADRPAAPVAAEKPAPKGDKLDDLLNSALGNRAKPSAARPREEEDQPARKPAAAASLATMGREDIVRGMQGVQPRVHDCFNQYKVPGTAMVHVNVARGGRVSAVSVSNKFAGTPTGSCIEAAVKGAHFPPVEAYSFDFPFALH